MIHRAVARFGGQRIMALVVLRAMALLAVRVWPAVVSSGIVQEHRGTSTVQPVPGQGTTCVVARPTVNAGAGS